MTRTGRLLRESAVGAALLFSLLMMTATPVPAQDQEPQTTAVEEAITSATVANVGKKGAEILDRLSTALAEGRRYRDMLPNASAEDSLVLRLQLAGARDRFLKVLGELAEAIAQARDDEAQGELRVRGELVYGAVTPQIWKLIGQLRMEIDGLRAERSNTAPADQPTLEAHLALLTGRLDRFYAHGWDHVQKMEAFGLETAGTREVLGGLLAERADEVSGRLELVSVRISGLRARLNDLPGDSDLTVRLVTARMNLETNLKSQGKALDIMDAMKLPTGRYREQLVTMTNDLAAGLLDAKLAARIIRRGWLGVKNWFSENGPSFAVQILLFLVIVFGGRLLSRPISRAVEKSLHRANLNMSFLLKRMVVTFTRNTIVVLALILGLAQLGLSLGPLLAGFGVVGFILGFAMQDSLSNLAAGMMILINRPYDVGDLVEISGVFGKVENMSMVSTSVLTLDNQKLVVPNSKIWGDVIKNVTDQRVRRVDMTFGISYTDDIPHAEEVFNGILAGHEKVLDDPEPMVRLHTLNDSSVDFVVRPWVKTDDYWDVYWDVTRAVKMRFDEEGISIPFPQRDVHIYEESRLPEGKAHEADSHENQPPVPKTGQDEPGGGESE